MSTLIATLRRVAQDLRRRPIPLSDLIPLLQQAADRIEQLENEKGSK